LIYDTQDFANGLYLRMRVRVGLLCDGDYVTYICVSIYTVNGTYVIAKICIKDYYNKESMIFAFIIREYSQVVGDLAVPANTNQHYQKGRVLFELLDFHGLP
jgi:hypothetical protein